VGAHGHQPLHPVRVRARGSTRGGDVPVIGVVIMGVYVLLVASPRARHAIADRAAGSARKHRGGLLLLAVIAVVVLASAMHGGH